MKFARLLLLGIVLAAAAHTACAADIVPVPDFSTYKIPNFEYPPARSQWLEYADVAALAVALALASYFALRRRSRRALFVLGIVSLAWLGFWRKGCICPIGAIQNIALALSHARYVVPASVVAIFALPLVFTLFFGRTFCAAVCPLGAVQELVALWPIKMPRWLDEALGLLAFVYLGAAVIAATTCDTQLICRYDPFVAIFRLSAGWNMLLLAASFVVVGLFIGRPYCRYLCPYGALLGMLARVARHRVRIPPQTCIQCRLCEDACPYGAIREPSVAIAPAERRRGRRRLVLLLVALPCLVAGLAWLGVGLQTPLARLHPTFALAQRLRLEETHQVEGTTDASEAFRNSGRAARDLYREAGQIAHSTARAGGWLGAWVGLVIGLKLIHLSVRRERKDYEPDPANCVACGRCFWYCPEEHSRQELLMIKQNRQ